MQDVNGKEPPTTINLLKEIFQGTETELYCTLGKEQHLLATWEHFPRGA